jgi:hypothetical protein
MDENPYQAPETPPESPLPSGLLVRLWFFWQWYKRYVWRPFLVIMGCLFIVLILREIARDIFKP